MSYTAKNIFAPVPQTERGKPVVIGGDAKNKKNITYCVGKTALIRNMENPIECFQYTNHKSNTTVAKMSPSGFYVASAEAGKVIVWDSVGEDHVVKLEKETIAKVIDIAWTQDSKRICVVGEGQRSFGEAFFMDSGASVGEISGHSKGIASVDIKQTRPFRLATGGEDFKVNWFPGPPFKYDKTILEHTRYVNCVRFAPDGSKFISVGSDKQGLIYDGKTADRVGQLSSENAHKGSIYSCSWSPDSKRILTASADKTCKIWDADTGACLTTFTFPNEVHHQQLGCLWQGDELLSVSLRGDINYLDTNNPSTPKRIQHGHNKIITALTYDKVGSRLYSADFGGWVVGWGVNDAKTVAFDGTGHKSQVHRMVVSGGKLVTISLDDTLKLSDITSHTYGESISLGAQPLDVAAEGGVVFVVCQAQLLVVQNNAVANTVALSYGGQSVAVRSDGSEVAVGGADNSIHLYSVSGTTLSETSVLTGHRGPITCLGYSPDGKYLGAGDTTREVKVWEGSKDIAAGGFVFHTSRVTSLAWAADSDHLLTGSLDSSAIVWSASTPNKKVIIKGAHYGGVKGVAWVDSNTVATTGQDCTIKTWTISY